MGKKCYKRILTLLFLFWTAVILYGSLAPGDDVPPMGWLAAIPYYDKIIHFIFYLGEATLLLLLFDIPYRSQIYIVAGVIALSGLIELVQAQVGRNGDIADFIANSLGACMGMAMASVLHKWLEKRMPHLCKAWSCKEDARCEALENKG